jgi:hypothetical protein
VVSHVFAPLRPNGTGVISITVKPNPSRIFFSAALCD